VGTKRWGTKERSLATEKKWEPTQWHRQTTKGNYYFHCFSRFTWWSWGRWQRTFSYNPAELWILPLWGTHREIPKEMDNLLRTSHHQLLHTVIQVRHPGLGVPKLLIAKTERGHQGRSPCARRASSPLPEPQLPMPSRWQPGQSQDQSQHLDRVFHPQHRGFAAWTQRQGKAWEAVQTSVSAHPHITQWCLWTSLTTSPPRAVPRGHAQVKLPSKWATDVPLGEDGVQAKWGLGIWLLLGDEGAKAADLEVRESPRVGTEHGEKRAAAFGKKKASPRFAFLLDVCGLNCWPLKFSSSQNCWLTDRLSRTLRKSLCPTQGRFLLRKQSPQTLPASHPGCCSQADRAGMFQGSASHAAGLGGHCAKRKRPAPPSSCPWSWHPDVCYLVVNWNQLRALKPNSCSGAGSACSPLQHNPSSCRSPDAKCKRSWWTG